MPYRRLGEPFRGLGQHLGAPRGAAGEQYETPSYANTGGTGNRIGVVIGTMSPANTSVWGPHYTAGPNQILNGNTGTGAGYMANGAAVAGAWYQWDFSAIATKVLITEAKFYVTALMIASGVFKWQGYNGATWEDIGGTFTLGVTGVSGKIQTFGTLSGNTKGYSKYRILGVSGNASFNLYYFAEIEFKIGSIIT